MAACTRLVRPAVLYCVPAPGQPEASLLAALVARSSSLQYVVATAGHPATQLVDPVHNRALLRVGEWGGAQAHGDHSFRHGAVPGTAEMDWVQSPQRIHPLTLGFWRC